MDALAYTPEQYAAFWSGVGAVATVAAAAVAIFTLFAIRRDSRDRARPVLAADLLPVALSHGTVELVIQNVGVGVAKEVRVSFEPPVLESHGQIAGFLARRYQPTIPTMGPGRRLTNIYAHWVGDGSHDLREPVPKDLAVTIRYRDTHNRQYEDLYELSTGTLRNQTTTSPSDTDDAGMRRRLVKAVEVIARGIDRC